MSDVSKQIITCDFYKIIMRYYCPLKVRRYDKDSEIFVITADKLQLLN